MWLLEIFGKGGLGRCMPSWWKGKSWPVARVQWVDYSPIFGQIDYSLPIHFLIHCVLAVYADETIHWVLIHVFSNADCPHVLSLAANPLSTMACHIRLPEEKR